MQSIIPRGGGREMCRRLVDQRWSIDFVSDALPDGRRFRILTVADDLSRANLVLAADTSLSGQRVSRELDRVIAERGMPRTIVPPLSRIAVHYPAGQCTTAPSSSAWQSANGFVLIGTTSRRENLGRTVPSKASTASYAPLKHALPGSG